MTQPRSTALAGIGLMVLGIFLFCCNDALGKWLLGTYSVWQMLAIRSAAAMLLLAPLLWREGRAVFDNPEDQEQVVAVLRYVDNTGEPTEAYPYNPNGSPGGLTAVTTEDGRFTIMMPHPERVFRTVQMSWHPENWGEDSPWMRMFRNARRWVR